MQIVVPSQRRAGQSTGHRAAASQLSRWQAGIVPGAPAFAQAGLIQGGALENALVCNGDSWVNPPLRFANEPVRHKLLDLIGDLAFVGLPKAQIFAFLTKKCIFTN